MASIACCGITMIGIASAESIQQSQAPVHFSQQHCSTFGTDAAAVEPSDHSTPIMLVKLELLLLGGRCYTVLTRAVLLVAFNLLLIK